MLTLPSKPTLLLWMYRHLWCFAIVGGGMNALNFYMGVPWWAFWPTAVWSVIAGIHYMTVKALTIEDYEVDERAWKLRQDSYDFDHISDIQKRIVDDDFSVRPRSDKQDD